MRLVSPTHLRRSLLALAAALLGYLLGDPAPGAVVFAKGGKPGKPGGFGNPLGSFDPRGGLFETLGLGKQREGGSPPTLPGPISLAPTATQGAAAAPGTPLSPLVAGQAPGVQPSLGLTLEDELERATRGGGGFRVGV
jgi:hypothetical protein